MAECDVRCCKNNVTRLYSLEGIETKFDEHDLGALFIATVNGKEGLEHFKQHLQGKDVQFIHDMAVLAAKEAGKQWRSWKNLRDEISSFKSTVS